MRHICQYNQEEPDNELIIHVFPETLGCQRFYDDQQHSYEVKYQVTDSELLVEIENPLDCSRRLNLIIHGMALEGRMEENADLLCPFEAGYSQTSDIPAGTSRKFSFKLRI